MLHEGRLRTGDPRCATRRATSTSWTQRDIIVSAATTLLGRGRDLLASHPGVAEARCSARRRQVGRGGVRLVVPKQGSAPGPTSSTRCRAHLAGYKVPKFIVLKTTCRARPTASSQGRPAQAVDLIRRPGLVSPKTRCSFARACAGSWSPRHAGAPSAAWTARRPSRRAVRVGSTRVPAHAFPRRARRPRRRILDMAIIAEELARSSSTSSPPTGRRCSAA